MLFLGLRLAHDLLGARLPGGCRQKVLAGPVAGVKTCQVCQASHISPLLDQAGLHGGQAWSTPAQARPAQFWPVAQRIKAADRAGCHRDTCSGTIFLFPVVRKTDMIRVQRTFSISWGCVKRNRVFQATAGRTKTRFLASTI